jgi:hypothetical protein
VHTDALIDAIHPWKDAIVSGRRQARHHSHPPARVPLRVAA